MPFKSEAQRRKFYAMSNRGEISKETVKEWEDATPKDKKLPNRVVKKAFDQGFLTALAHFKVGSVGETIGRGLDYFSSPHGFPNVTAPMLGTAAGVAGGNLGLGVGTGLGALAGGHGGAALGKLLSQALGGRGGQFTQNAIQDLPRLLSTLGTIGGGLGAASALKPSRKEEKTATSEEIRLQLPRREYHGLDAALRSTARGEKKADGPDAEQLAKVLQTFDTPPGDQPDVAQKDRLDRATMWGSASHLGAGDTANRVSDMGQPTQIGTAF